MAFLGIKFTWKKLKEILEWVIPIISKSKGGSSMAADAPKPGLFTVQTVEVKPVSQSLVKVPHDKSTQAVLVPGAVAAGAHPAEQVQVKAGLAVSLTQIGLVAIQVILVARLIGDATGLFHIPIGLEEQFRVFTDRAGLVVQSVLGIIAAFAAYRLRASMPATVVLEKKPEKTG